MEEISVIFSLKYRHKYNNKNEEENPNSLTKAGVIFSAGMNLHAPLLLIGFMLPEDQMFDVSWCLVLSES